MNAADAELVDLAPERLADVVELCAAAFPDETLSLDDLESICTAPGTSVLATSDGTGAVVVRGPGTGTWDPPATAHLQLLAVHPSRRSVRRAPGAS